MIVEHDFYVGLRDVNNNNELTNTGFLACIEDVANRHSQIVGWGVLDIEKLKKTWIVLSWKVEIIKRPKFNEFIKAQTWSRESVSYNAFRDFRIYNNKEELLARGTAKCFLIDIEKRKPIKIPDEIEEYYKPEKIKALENDNIEKLQEPKSFISCINYKITKNMIDVNNHVHNIYYMDIAKEVLPQDLSNEFNTFEIMYKKEIKLGETVKVYYSKVDDWNYVTIKSEDDKKLYSIIRLK